MHDFTCFYRVAVIIPYTSLIKGCMFDRCMKRNPKRMNLSLSERSVTKLKSLSSNLGGYSISRIVDHILIDVEEAEFVRRYVTMPSVQLYNLNKRKRAEKKVVEVKPVTTGGLRPRSVNTQDVDYLKSVRDNTDRIIARHVK